jgi:hypothetical protein
LFATFLSSLERGIAKSCLCYVVTGRIAMDRKKQAMTMKTKQRGGNFRKALRGIFRRRIRRHDPMLVLSMTFFNFTDGWSRTFANNK